jgi:hypothetical protein
VTQRRIWPTYWQQWIGRFAIKIQPARFYRKPEVVYITHVNSIGLLRGKILNSNVELFARPHQLVPYSPRLFDELYAQYRLREARQVVIHQTSKVRRA